MHFYVHQTEKYEGFSPEMYFHDKLLYKPLKVEN